MPTTVTLTPVTVTLAPGSLNWLTLFAPIIISVIGFVASIVTARHVARSALQGGRQQAIETETLRLRHEIANRRLSEFLESAKDLRLKLTPPVGNQLVEYVALGEFVTFWISLTRMADAMPLPSDREQFLPVLDRFSKECEATHDQALALWVGANSGMATSVDFTHGILMVLAALDNLRVAVDWAAERRLVGTAQGGQMPSLTEFAPTMEKFADIFGKRRQARPQGTGVPVPDPKDEV